ncbi:MAG: phosphonate C-P lyase system protein PhnH [Pseudomonadota bacterium]
MSATAALTGGLVDPPLDAAHAFRAIMNVMARPGEIRTLDQGRPPQPVSVATGTVLLTLCDPDTGVFLAGQCDTSEMRDWLAFHTGAPVVSPQEAQFALGAWADLLPLDQFSVGVPEYPDRSATLIVECSDLRSEGVRLQGPGIRDTAQLSLPETEAFAANHRLYPLGLDFMFTAGSKVAALPRSTAILEG